MATPKTVTLQWLSDGELKTKTFDFTRPLIIGRKESCDIWLDVNNVSRHHASIFVEEGRPYLLNMSQTNKVMFLRDNEEHYLDLDEETPLLIDMSFQVGDTRFNVVGVDFDTQLAGKEALMVMCEVCGRALPVTLIHCPYDGWALAGGETFIGKVD